MNTITVIGNVGKDPELRFTTKGKPVVKFAIADTHGKDEFKTTTWHEIVVYNEQAENVAERVRKGNRVLVTGRLTKATYQAKDGTQKTAVEILADDVCISLRFKDSGSATTKQPNLAIPSFIPDEEEPF
jgi:single-strand DNA-binding protein